MESRQARSQRGRCGAPQCQHLAALQLSDRAHNHSQSSRLFDSIATSVPCLPINLCAAPRQCSTAAALADCAQLVFHNERFMSANALGTHKLACAAVERPDAHEMLDAIKHGLKLDARVEEGKQYSRDWQNPGRVRVGLRQPDGRPCNTDIPTKAALLVKCSELCKRHQGRKNRLEQIQKLEAAMFSGGAATPKENKAAGGSTEKVGKSGKKKGKKK